MIATRFKRKVRKYNNERLVSIPPEIEGAFGWGEQIDVLFDGEKLTIEPRKEKLTTESRKEPETNKIEAEILSTAGVACA